MKLLLRLLSHGNMVGRVTLIRTECLHTMTEGICYVFDSLKVASVI